MNNKLYDALETCLQEIEKGAALESVIARYPDLANELRPILKASIQARKLSADPSAEAMRRGRAKLLQRASEMREAKIAPRKRVIPIFQRLALSLGMAATFLVSGTGLVGASATALPGENLYPVKRTWEDLQLLFTLDRDVRDVVKSQFEIERLHEVNELIAEGRHEVIQFAGVFMQVNGVYYVSGVNVLIPSNLQIPEIGLAVIVTGRTNAQGFVELESLELLPDGVFVPVGLPVEIESESESNSNSDINGNDGLDSISNSNDSDGSGGQSSDNGNEAGGGDKPEHREDFEVEGVVESLSETTLVIQGKTVYLESATIKGNLENGVKVEIKGYYAEDGRFIVTEVKVKGSKSDSNNNNDSGDNDSGSNDSGDNDSNDNDSGSNDSNDGSSSNDSSSNDNDSSDNDSNHNDNDNHNGGG
ncbi:DUF5666 domain-containing protein [Candidatus Villigracilis saccharophilus]|uniref:DUF5666 domain-containing protein n=1 Tax=Candidatus Villigracilis saccharophilus TaxID=3140684 RepID=UPI0031360C6E|nr:hypothetical protein [Anaerolineales bacterium]